MNAEMVHPILVLTIHPYLTQSARHYFFALSQGGSVILTNNRGDQWGTGGKRQNLKAKMDDGVCAHNDILHDHEVMQQSCLCVSLSCMNFSLWLEAASGNEVFVHAARHWRYRAKALG